MRRLRGVGLGLLGLLVLAAIWEFYKAFGPANGLVVGGRAITPRTGDRAMPHIWDTVTRLGEPATGRRGDPLAVALGHAVAHDGGEPVGLPQPPGRRGGAQGRPAEGAPRR